MPIQRSTTKLLLDAILDNDDFNGRDESNCIELTKSPRSLHVQRKLGQLLDSDDDRDSIAFSNFENMGKNDASQDFDIATCDDFEESHVTFDERNQSQPSLDKIEQYAEFIDDEDAEDFADDQMGSSVWRGLNAPRPHALWACGLSGLSPFSPRSASSPRFPSRTGGLQSHAHLGLEDVVALEDVARSGENLYPRIENEKRSQLQMRAFTPPAFVQRHGKSTEKPFFCSPVLTRRRKQVLCELEKVMKGISSLGSSCIDGDNQLHSNWRSASIISSKTEKNRVICDTDGYTSDAGVFTRLLQATDGLAKGLVEERRKSRCLSAMLSSRQDVAYKTIVHDVYYSSSLYYPVADVPLRAHSNKHRSALLPFFHKNNGSTVSSAENTHDAVEWPSDLRRGRRRLCVTCATKNEHIPSKHQLNSRSASTKPKHQFFFPSVSNVTQKLMKQINNTQSAQLDAVIN